MSSSQKAYFDRFSKLYNNENKSASSPPVVVAAKKPITEKLSVGSFEFSSCWVILSIAIAIFVAYLYMSSLKPRIPIGF